MIFPWPSHTYADLYDLMFSHCRTSIRCVFECGIGTTDESIPSNISKEGKPGASLRVWRDYFPNAMIFGADIDKNTLFQEDGIRILYIDQTCPETIKAFWAQVGLTDFDLIIDDDLHSYDAGNCMFEHSIDRFSQSGMYVIEDVQPHDIPNYEAYFRAKPYNAFYFTLTRQPYPILDNNLVIIKKAT